MDTLRRTPPRPTPRPHRSGRPHLAFLALLSVGAALPASAGQWVRPVVQIDRIHWVSGWFDPLDKPDFFATVTVTGADGAQLSCGSTPVVENILYQQPNIVLCSRRLAVLAPYTVSIDVEDADGAGSPPATDVRQPADLSWGPRRNGLITGLDLTSSFTAVSISGPEVAVTATILTEAAPIDFSTALFAPRQLDPVLGGQLVALATIDLPTTVALEVEDASGARFEVARGDFERFVRLTWDGRDPSGRPMPYGTYQLRLTAPGGSASQSERLDLVANRPLDFLSVVDDFPRDNNPRAALPAVDVMTPADADVTWVIGQNQRGTCTSIGADVRARVPAGTLTRLVWPAKDRSGNWVPPGRYCTEVRATRLSDGATYRPWPLRALPIDNPRPIFVEVKTRPEIPALVPSAIRHVVARARNDLGELRTVARLDVFADEFIPGNTRRGLVPIGSCTEVSECEVLLPPPRSSGTIAIRAEARDLDQLLPDDSGVRLVDLVPGPPGVDLRISVATLTDDDLVVELPRKFGVDIAFHNAIDGPEDGPGDQVPFLAAVARQIDTIRGFTVPFGRLHDPSANGRISSIQENIARTSFWAVATPATVVGQTLPLPTSLNLCSVIQAAWSGSADVNAVLHSNGLCRDNAGLNMFTANISRRNIAWHELHHSPFQESDENCCSNVYFQHPIAPNVYWTQGECVAFSSNPATCAMITSAGATVPFWVSDPQPNDVMNNNTTENADDLRRVRTHYALCAQGGC